MKERIQELMKQAGTDVSGKWMGVDHATKFAELIVQEMCEVMTAQSNGFALCSNYGAVQGIDVGVRKVKQHFGVEE